MRRPKVTSPCIADHYADKSRERIVEFSAANGIGGLIAIRQCPDDTVLVSVYRCDDGVIVAIGAPVKPAEPLVWILKITTNRGFSTRSDVYPTHTSALLALAKYARANWAEQAERCASSPYPRALPFPAEAPAIDGECVADYFACRDEQGDAFESYSLDEATLHY